jgi:hypothetical protein
VPVALWSAPAAPTLGATSLTTSSFTASTLGDISPYASPIPPGLLNLGTRLRITAQGSYTTSGTNSTLTWGFYMSNAGTLIASAVVLGISPAVTWVSGTGIPWIMQYFGHIAAVSVNLNSTTASIVGRGYILTGSSLTAFNTPAPIPQTLAAVTVAQTANGLSTITEQNVEVGLTPGASVTSLTNVITDELTCELIG